MWRFGVGQGVGSIRFIYISIQRELSKHKETRGCVSAEQSRFEPVLNKYNGNASAVSVFDFQSAQRQKEGDGHEFFFSLLVAGVATTNKKKNSLTAVTL